MNNRVDDPNNGERNDEDENEINVPLDGFDRLFNEIMNMRNMPDTELGEDDFTDDFEDDLELLEPEPAELQATEYENHDNGLENFEDDLDDEFEDEDDFEDDFDDLDEFEELDDDEINDDGYEDFEDDFDDEGFIDLYGDDEDDDFDEDDDDDYYYDNYDE